MAINNNEEITQKAIAFAKTRKKQIAKRLTSKEIFPPELHPVSVFMAGSPGAGKTEAARELIQKISNKSQVLRIDSDEIRCEFEDYNGKNSALFQGATSIVVEKMHDLALKQKQSFVFDGTLSNLEKTVDNINRSLSKDREIFIVYVYQDPTQAWSFVQKRAEKDGRDVPKTAFVNQYFAARFNVTKIKESFKDRVQLDLIVKNIDGSNFLYKENIDIVDNYIKEKYSIDTLNSALE